MQRTQQLDSVGLKSGDVASGMVIERQVEEESDQPQEGVRPVLDFLATG